MLIKQSRKIFAAVVEYLYNSCALKKSRYVWQMVDIEGIDYFQIKQIAMLHVRNLDHGD